jgi:hypothetical protein
MGTVRLTDKRKNEYKGKAQEMFEKSNPRPDFTPEETISIMQAMTNHPFQTACRNFVIEQNALYNVDDNDEDSTLPFNFTMEKTKLDTVACRLVANDDAVTCYLPTQLVMFGETGWRYGNSKNALDFIPDKYLDNPKDILIMQAAIRRVDSERKAQANARKTFMGGVKDALENCNTLGQLIKLWPAASKLASADDISQLHKKETRTQQANRVREEIDLDVSTLNSTVLTASLLGD